MSQTVDEIENLSTHETQFINAYTVPHTERTHPAWHYDVLAIRYGYEACAKEKDVNSIHSCHDSCQRLACVQRREIDNLKADLAAKDANYTVIARKLESTISKQDAEIEKWKSTCGRYNSDNAGTLAQLDTLKETNRLLLVQMKAALESIEALAVKATDRGTQRFALSQHDVLRRALADLGEVST